MKYGLKPPLNKSCLICKKKFEPTNIIKYIYLSLESKILLYFFFRKKLNSDLAKYILNLSERISTYIHVSCNKKYKSELTNICWYIYNENNMYVSNQYYLHHS